NRHWNVALRRKEYPCPLSTDEHVATVDVRQQPLSVDFGGGRLMSSRSQRQDCSAPRTRIFGPSWSSRQS
ncbi:MAG: hypothetical protein BRD30_02690, partial [Bacteroidetes bacterium QH_2_63_10]